MRAGFIVPTSLEANNFNKYDLHVSSIGYGAGKAVAEHAAADLIFNKKCDTIIVWGLAGGLSERVKVGDIVIGESTAYRDYNIAPLMNSNGLGYVQGFAENTPWATLDRELNNLLRKALEETFPNNRIITDGKICTGDQFVQHISRDKYNEIEKNADAVDMESMAVVHFCENINIHSNKNIKVGIVRVISDNADNDAHTGFDAFLKSFSDMNSKSFDIRQFLLEKGWNNDMAEILGVVKDYNDFPRKGVLFKDIWGVFKNHTIFDNVCHKMFDLFNIYCCDIKITKLAGIESRGFILGYELSRMFGVPFVPVRKAGKLPGTVSGEEYKTEYSSTKLEVQNDMFYRNDNVLLVDDILATGGTLIAAKKAIEKTGAACNHSIVFGRIAALNGDKNIGSANISASWVVDF